MNGIARLLRVLDDGERALAKELLATGERHRADHEIFHVGSDLARWSRAHSERIAATADHYGLDLRHEPIATPSHRPTEERAAESGHAEPGLLLLWDLCDLHLRASRNSLYWTMLAQAAQARGDNRLLTLVSGCHPQTLRQMRWTNTMIKNLAPQLLTKS
ncbi:hypothetical protein AB0D12_35900 [Streptomyces sp. NPDC048479]|uniref:hypothetical protein n=1 Tax=Streptomyces sp. NPDC048479 TaxID=3154725 RepID=UPI00341E4BFF